MRDSESNHSYNTRFCSAIIVVQRYRFTSSRLCRSCSQFVPHATEDDREHARSVINPKNRLTSLNAGKRVFTVYSQHTDSCAEFFMKKAYSRHTSGMQFVTESEAKRLSLRVRTYAELLTSIRYNFISFSLLEI